MNISNKFSNLSNLLLILIVSISTAHGFQRSGGDSAITSSSANHTQKRFLSGQLEHLDDQVIKTSVGNYRLDLSIRIRDNRHYTQQEEQTGNVQLTFINDRLVQVSLY